MGMLLLLMKAVTSAIPGFWPFMHIFKVLCLNSEELIYRLAQDIATCLAFTSKSLSRLFRRLAQGMSRQITKPSQEKCVCLLGVALQALIFL